MACNLTVGVDCVELSEIHKIAVRMDSGFSSSAQGTMHLLPKSDILKDVQIIEKDKEPENIIVKSKERVNLFELNLKEISWRNKYKDGNY